MGVDLCTCAGCIHPLGLMMNHHHDQLRIKAAPFDGQLTPKILIFTITITKQGMRNETNAGRGVRMAGSRGEGGRAVADLLTSRAIRRHSWFAT